MITKEELEEKAEELQNWCHDRDVQCVISMSSSEGPWHVCLSEINHLHTIVCVDKVWVISEALKQRDIEKALGSIERIDVSNRN